MKRTHHGWLGISIVMLAAPAPGAAQADEIQVYDGGLSPAGVFNLTWHNNYTPSGLDIPGFPGGVTSRHAWVGVPEWAYGVSDWFEAGLYMPLYSVDEDLGATLDGFKLRTLFAVPDADDRQFFYGANFEFSYNGKHWDPKRFTSEIRPIVGWHLTKVDMIFNPIIDTSWDGFGKLELVPATRLAWNVSDVLALAVEEYAALGTFDDFASPSQQSHQVYAVADRATQAMDIEVGIGFGLTGASDDLTLKLILSRDLN